MSQKLEFRLRTDSITLGQLLKVMDFISSGGEARDYIADHQVCVNSQSCDERGRKLHRGDLVVIDDLYSIDLK